MNSKTKNREGVSDLNIDPKSRLTDSDKEKADVLGHFFFKCLAMMVTSLIFHQWS